MIRRLLAAIVRWAVDGEVIANLNEQEQAATASVQHLHKELHPLEEAWYADGPERRAWWQHR